MSKPASTVQNIVQPLTQFSASLFIKLPVEIQLEILSHCQTNDLVCLSLVSRFFRTLTLPLTPKKPSLLSYDQNLSPDAVSAACGYNLFSGVEYNTYSHRRRHHAFTFTTEDAVAHDRLVATQGAAHSCRNWMTCRRYPPDHPVCQRPWCRHCVCISCPLYTRLRGWMGEDLKYCQKCRKFTKRARTKKYQGRCLHGRPKVRRTPNNHWTPKKGVSYGYRWWRRWGTSGVDSWGYENNDRTMGSSDLIKRINARVV
ncbi:hypothetical protein EsH8_VII_000939 [Colletotrichum jinshuiense]